MEQNNALADLRARLARLETADTPTLYSKAGITPDGGLFVYLTAGEALVRGEVVYCPQAPAGASGKVWKNAVNSDMPLGVVYANADANAPVKVVVSGIAYVLPEAGFTAARGNVIYSSDATAGRVDQSAGIPSATQHWREIGHFIEDGSGNGAAARALLHFN